jgi:hypothetical protein
LLADDYIDDVTDFNRREVLLKPSARRFCALEYASSTGVTSSSRK